MGTNLPPWPRERCRSRAGEGEESPIWSTGFWTSSAVPVNSRPLCFPTHSQANSTFQPGSGVELTGSTLIPDWQLMAAKEGRVSCLQRHPHCSSLTPMDMSYTNCYNRLRRHEFGNGTWCRDLLPLPGVGAGS